MPFFSSHDSCRIFYRVEGPRDAPAVILSNSLGTDHMMWQAQASALAQQFFVVRYDQRGHGASDVFHADYTVDQLGRDALALAERLGLKRFSFCGLSMGGLTGQWLAVNAADRIDRLALANTSAQFPPPEMWDERMAAIRDGGMAAISDTVLGRFFTQRFDQAQPATVARFQHVLEHMEPEGYLGCCAAIKAADMRDELKQISTPTLVISGEHDQSTPPDRGHYIAGEIEGAEHIVLDAAHLSNVEQPAAFLQALIDHLS